MKKLKLIIALLLVSPFTMLAQDLFERVDSIVASYHNKNPEVSISFALLKGEETFYTSYGQLSRGGERPVDKNSLFEIASITKIITSNLIAQAVLEGKLKVNDPIDQYLPKVYSLHGNIKNKISIADLASHQSGLPDLDFLEMIKKDQQQPAKLVDQEMLTKMINGCDQLIDYGSYRYSTVGYTLLGQILEGIYGKPYDQLLNERIFRPLAMKRSFTTFYAVDNVVQGYNGEGGEQELFVWNIVAPSGLVKSSTADAMKFLQAIMDKENFIGKAALLTEVPYYSEGNEAIGLATNIIQENGETIYLKSGDSMGQSSMLCYNREANWGLVFFINQNNSKMRNELLGDLYELALK